MKDRKKRKFHLRKRTKQLIILFCVLFVSITAGLTISSVRKNSLISNTAYLNRFNISEEAKDNHEAVTDINGETPNEFAAKVKEANQSDTGNESKVIVNTPVGEEERLSNMVKDMNAVSYDTYTVVRFGDEDDKAMFVKNMEYSKYDYQDDGIVQIAGIGGFHAPSYSEETALPVSDTPAKDAHDQGKLLVAVIDTGCGTEADSSVNFTTDSDMDNNGHGTAMAKIIREKSDGKAYILSLKAIGDNGEGTISNVTAAVKYAIEQGADIINMSIIAKDSDNMAAFKSVVKDATARSIKVVAAAGNFSDDVSNYVPANVSGVISVGAVTEDGMIADFSNYGKTLTMSVKDANSTSEATAIVSGYLAGSKKLGSQSDIAGNYTENPKNEKKDTPLIDKDKLVPQGVQFDVNVMYGDTQWGAAKNWNYKYEATGVGQAVVGRADESVGGTTGAFFNVVYNGRTFSDEYGPYSGSGKAITDFWSPEASVYDIQLYVVRPFFGWRIKSVKIEGDGEVTSYAPYGGHHTCMKVHGNSGYVRIDINVEPATTATIHLNSYDSINKLTGYFNSGTVPNNQWKDNTNALTWASMYSWAFWTQPGLSPSSAAPGRYMEGFYDGNGIKYFNQDMNAYTPPGGTYYWSPDWSNDSSTWPKEITNYGYWGPSGDVYLSARYGYFINVNSLMKGSDTSRAHFTINGENYEEIGAANVTATDYEGNEWSNASMAGVTDAIEFSIKYQAGVNGKTDINNENLTDFNGVVASPDVYLTITKVDPAYQISKISYGNFDLIADGTTADPANGKYLGTYHLRAHNSVVASQNATGDDRWYDFDIFTEKKPEQPVDVNSTYVVRGTDANGNPTSKEVYAYNIQHNPMKYIEGNINYGNPETNGAVTKERAEKERPYEKELGTFSAQISGGYSKYDNVADFAGYYPASSTLTLSNPVLPNGYTFLGYDVFDKDNNEIMSTTSSEVSASVANGVSVYIRAQGVSYKVTYDSNAGGTAGTPNDPQTEMPSGTMTPQTLHYGQLESLEKCGYTWAGHKFLGWSTNPKATKPDTYNVYTVNEYKKSDQKTQDPAKDVQLTDGATAFWDYFGKDLGDYAHKDGATITLYAVWEPVETTLKVDPNGGTWNNSKSAQTFTQNWGTTKDLGTPTAPAYTATVSFDLNFDPTDPNKEENEAKPHSPTPSSVTLKYVFKNWTVNSGGKGYMKGNVYIFQSTNDTVTANYYFQNMTLPTVTREGYTFLGWYREAGCLTKAGNAGYTEYRPEKSETLYARWRKDTYTYKDTIEVTDTDTQDTKTERSMLVRKTDTYGTVLTQKGFTIGIYKQNLLGGLGDKVYELKTGEGLYKADGTLVDDTADANGYYELKDPAAGKYVAHEEEAPAGWFMSDDYKFVVAGTSGERVTVELEDSKIVKPPHDNPVKKDSYGRALTQAVFELKDNTTNKVIGSYSIKRNNITKRTDFPTEMYESLQAGHSYTLTETNPPDGFETATYSFDVPRTGTDGLKAISILDQAKTTGQLQIKKVDSTDKPLKGAEFQLFMKDETGTLVPCMMDKASGKWTNAAESDTVVPMKGTTDDGGTITWMNLPLRASFTGSEPDFCKSYYLVETKAPEGYSLTNKVMEIRLDDNAKDKAVTYTVKDGRVTVTLDAGGNGVAWFTGIGVTVMTAALLLAVRAKRKQAE